MIEFERYKNMRDRFEIEEELKDVQGSLAKTPDPYQRGYVDALKFVLWDWRNDNERI